MSESKKEEMVAGLRNHEEIHDLYSLPNIIRMSEMMEHVTHGGGNKTFVGKNKGKGPHRR
jgi:hypothetical protein